MISSLRNPARRIRLNSSVRDIRPLKGRICMNTWLRLLPAPDHTAFSSPEELARWELSHALPDESIILEQDSSLGDGWRLSRSDGNRVLRGGTAGLLYGAYSLILRRLSGKELPEEAASSPRYALRMIDCWDNMDGSVERGYSGRSLFFESGRFTWDPARMRELGRLLASVGLNVLCINNVNVHAPAQELLGSFLPELARLDEIFRPFGVRLMVSVDFSQPLQDGLPTADPLNPEVRAWWRRTTEKVYAAIPDLAGFLVKADSENRPGPYAYGRTHAEGANMLAAALAPFGGVLVWRAFVYNCHQDWRDTSTDRPKAAWEHYMPLDGLFDRNVILQVKHGPFDFQVREPLSPLLLAMRNTSMAMEVQLAQEYTGHQIDLYTMIPMWKELFEELPANRITALAAVSNLGHDDCITGHPLAAVNLYTYGLFAWNPSLDPSGAVRDWARLSWSLPEAQEEMLVSLLLSSRRIYEKYTAPLGIGWMVNPHEHYGPNPSGYEFDQWGTYHKADRNAVGIDRTHAGTGFLDQYPEELRRKYENPASCPDLYLLFYHRLPYTWRMRDGRTLIQRIYDDHFEGCSEAEALVQSLRSMDFPAPDRELILSRAERQLANAREWCDVINTFFHRLSGIPDEQGRIIYP